MTRLPTIKSERVHPLTTVDLRNTVSAFERKDKVALMRAACNAQFGWPFGKCTYPDCVCASARAWPCKLER
jgi:hypothetical protein